MWSLYLRNAFELPLLALLEAKYRFTPIHAAAIAGPNGAILILGPNGAGKSTLACSLAERMGLRLMADNYCPSDGALVAGFPGTPRSKPGDDLPALRPSAGTAPIRGVVILSSPTAQGKRDYLRAYLDQPFESHRGTAWEQLFSTASSAEEVLDAAGASLSRLPCMFYQRETAGLLSVESFAREALTT